MHYRFVPICITDGTLFVGMVDPDDMEAHDALNFISSSWACPLKFLLLPKQTLPKFPLCTKDFPAKFPGLFQNWKRKSSWNQKVKMARNFFPNRPNLKMENTKNNWPKTLRSQK